MAFWKAEAEALRGLPADAFACDAPDETGLLVAAVLRRLAAFREALDHKARLLQHADTRRGVVGLLRSQTAEVSAHGSGHFTPLNASFVEHTRRLHAAALAAVAALTAAGVPIVVARPLGGGEWGLSLMGVLGHADADAEADAGATGLLDPLVGPRRVSRLVAEAAVFQSAFHAGDSRASNALGALRKDLEAKEAALCRRLLLLFGVDDPAALADAAGAAGLLLRDHAAPAVAGALTAGLAASGRGCVESYGLLEALLRDCFALTEGALEQLQHLVGPLVLSETLVKVEAERRRGDDGPAAGLGLGQVPVHREIWTRQQIKEEKLALLADPEGDQTAVVLPF